MNKRDPKIKRKEYASENEKAQRAEIVELFKNCPIPENELLENLGLFIKRKDLTRVLFMNEIYQKQVDVHGVIMEFGCRWGQNMALFESFRGIYEPYNHNRKIIGFDTFSGFLKIDKKDAISDVAKVGYYATTPGYEKYLGKVLEYHESESPISHIKKFEIIKGDATITLKKYLKENPETIISLAYFDMDLGEPTKKCLRLIKNHIAKGTVIGFDELNVHDWGETEAFKEVLGLANHRIIRSKYSTVNSYIVIE